MTMMPLKRKESKAIQVQAVTPITNTPSPVPPPLPPPLVHQVAPPPPPLSSLSNCKTNDKYFMNSSKQNESFEENNNKSISQDTSKTKTIKKEEIAREKFEELQKYNYQRQLDMIGKKVEKIMNDKIKSGDLSINKNVSNNESDIEMFYFTSESPTRKAKTLMKNKTQKLFKGFCKHLQNQANNLTGGSKHILLPNSSSTPNSELYPKNGTINKSDKPGKPENGRGFVYQHQEGSFYFRLTPEELIKNGAVINLSAFDKTYKLSKITDNSHPPSHRYQHQNIFKTLFKSKNTLKHKCDQCHKLVSACQCDANDGTKDGEATIIVKTRRKSNGNNDVMVKRFEGLVESKASSRLLLNMTPNSDKYENNDQNFGSYVNTGRKSVELLDLKKSKSCKKLNSSQSEDKQPKRFYINDENTMLENKRKSNLNEKVKTREKIKNHMKVLANVLNEKFRSKSKSPDRTNHLKLNRMNTSGVINKRRISSRRKGYVNSGNGMALKKRNSNRKIIKRIVNNEKQKEPKTSKQLLKVLSAISKKKEPSTKLLPRQTEISKFSRFSPSPILNEINYYEEELDEPNIYELDDEMDMITAINASALIEGSYKKESTNRVSKTLRHRPTKNSSNYAKRMAATMQINRNNRVIPRITTDFQNESF